MADTSRISRVTDLFTEGTEVFLGSDADGKPVVIWVQKLNSFQTEEARRDGAARRGLRMSQLGRPDSAETAGVKAEMALWTQRELAEALVAQRGQELQLEVFDDLETDPAYRERLDRIQRIPEQLDAAGAPDDDPRRAALLQEQEEWMLQVNEATKRATDKAIREASEQDRDDLERAFLERWRDAATMDVFMAERRVTQLYYAMRACEAVDVSTGLDQHQWDHSACDHSVRLCDDRAQVYSLPDVVQEKVIAALEAVTVPARAAGNSDAPASSSASSEPSAPAEADSTPSSPDATPSAAPTT